MTRRVLVADDEPDVRFMLGAHLRRRGWDVEEAVDGTDALTKLGVSSYDAVVLDQRMPGASGLDIARELGGKQPTIVFSAYLEPRIRAELDSIGCPAVAKDDLDALFRFLDELDEE